jgi:diguanylate cyclase (GGDEF)-like protein
VLLLQRASLLDAESVVQRVRQQLDSSDVPGLPNGRRVTVSFGIAPVQSLEHLSKALSRADALLYEAKQAGRNRVRVDAKPRLPAWWHHNRTDGGAMNGRGDRS